MLADAVNKSVHHRAGNNGETKLETNCQGTDVDAGLGLTLGFVDVLVGTLGDAIDGDINCGRHKLHNTMQLPKAKLQAGCFYDESGLPCRP